MPLDAPVIRIERGSFIFIPISQPDADPTLRAPRARIQRGKTGGKTGLDIPACTIQNLRHALSNWLVYLKIQELWAIEPSKGSKEMKRILGSSAVALAVIAAGILALPITATPADAQTKIRVGRTTGASGFHIPSYVAMDRGFFKREGLEARYVSMSGKALVTAGLGGAIDFVPIPGGGSQATLKGAELRYVVGESLISQWTIVVDPSIKSVADLKGKTIGYGRAGSADYDEGEITLSQYFNMEVGRDYNVISFQDEVTRLAGLINGATQAGLLSFPHAAKAEVAGFKILLKTGEYLPRVGGTFWVTAEYLKENRGTVQKFIRAIAKATQYLRENKQGSIPVIQKYFGIKNAKEAGFIWDNVHDQYGPDIPAHLFQKLFESRRKRMVKRGLWPKDKPLPNIEKYVARDLLQTTLRGMGYYLQAPPKVEGKLN
jgi:NitT/TauT family transport system substrate-binding protein